MNNDVVATLPFSPIHAYKLGFYSLFAFTHHLAATHNVGSVFSLNTLGKELSDELIVQIKQTAKLLDIEPENWWLDRSLDHKIVEAIIQKLAKNNIIQVQERDICKCSCGKVEYLANIKLYGKKSLIVNGYASCCHTYIQKTREYVLMTTPLPSVTLPQNIFPDWAKTEFSEKLKKLIYCELLVSRTAKRCFSVILAGKRWNIDNDVIWWLYPSWLSMGGSYIKHLIFGASTIQQAAIMHLITAHTGLPQPTHYYCLPKVFFAPVCNLTTIDLVTARFGSERIANALLWSALSKRKEFILSGSILPSMRDRFVNISTTNSRRLLQL